MRIPAGCTPATVPVDGYGEDYDFWVDARAATRAGDDEYDAWIRHWVLDVESQEQWLERLGPERVAALRAKADPDSWRADAAAYPPDLDAPVNAWERARGVGRASPRGACRRDRRDAVLAGAGVANLAAWLGVQLARDAGSDVKLTAEIGLWDYDATLGDPFVLNHRNFPTATMLADAQFVLGALVGGPGTTTIGCLGGAQVDRVGNINSTWIPPRPFLVGSGGGNDVASTAAENVIVATLTAAAHRRRLQLRHLAGHARAGAGHRPRAVREARRRAAGDARSRPASSFDEVQRAVRLGARRRRPASCPCSTRRPPTRSHALRRWDPRGWFLRAR